MNRKHFEVQDVLIFFCDDLKKENIRSRETDEEILESVRPSTGETDEENDDENADVVEVFDEPVNKPFTSQQN